MYWFYTILDAIVGAESDRDREI